MYSTSNGVTPEQPAGHLDSSATTTTTTTTSSPIRTTTTITTRRRAIAGYPSPLPLWCRFYFYGMHGVLDEVVFTALFDLFFEPGGNRQLMGCTSIMTFFIYGSCSIAVEYVFLYCIRRQYSLKIRLPVYVMILYFWELGWGLALRQVDACSWDYSHYPLNLFGLITLTYLPCWAALCVLQDRIYYYIFCLHVGDIEYKIKVL